MVLLVCIVFALACVSVCVGKTSGTRAREKFCWMFSVDRTQNSLPAFTFGPQPNLGCQPATVFLPHQKALCGDGGRDRRAFALATEVFLLGKTLARC